MTKTIFLGNEGRMIEYSDIDELRKEAKKYHIEIGNNFEIGDECIIEDNCKIEDNVTIGDNCWIKENVKIGDNVKMGKKCYVEKDCRIPAWEVFEGNVTIRNLNISIDKDERGYVIKVK